MDGWRIRRGIEGDIPFFIGVIALLGVLVGLGLGVGVDVLLHHHRGTL